ncbi:MAG: nucleoside-diphosphate sugar epimerase/dehydratase, partial [Candidatus Zipacnadales bacterium]
MWSPALLLGFWILFSLGHPGYLPRPYRPLITTAHQCLFAVALGSAAYVGLLYVLSPANLAHRGIILPASLMMFVSMVVLRHLAAAVAPRQAFTERYLILGDGERARLIANELRNGRSPYKKIVGLIPVHEVTELQPPVPVVDDTSSAPDIIRQQDVTHLVVCVPQ